MCIDYIALKTNVIISAYLIPCINNVLDHLGGSVTFSKIDLAQSYHKVWLAKGSQA